jgi:hypothetical protein
MTCLSAASFDLTATTFFKTPTGLREIQTRALGLPGMIRRVLVLVDGKRSGKELAAFVGGEENIAEVLDQLMANGCIDAQQTVRPIPVAQALAAMPPAAKTATFSDPDDSAALASLPHAALRSAKEVEMARNFMVNTTNNIFGQNMRLSLVKSILNCRGAEELREIFPVWTSNMASNTTGARELPEMRDRLLLVL